jgi:hypothetical protein
VLKLTMTFWRVTSNSMNNKIKVTMGLIFIIVAFGCLMAAIFFINLEHQVSSKEMSTLQVEMVNLLTERSQQVFSQTEQEIVKRPVLTVEDFLARSEMIYGPEELKRKNGILWIDRQEDSLLITLGAVNGLQKGSYLNVYQERRQPDGFLINEKIAEVIVDKAYDIISYVQPVKKTVNDFTKEYYRVTIQ